MPVGRFKKNGQYCDIDAAGVYDTELQASQAQINTTQDVEIANLKSALQSVAIYDTASGAIAHFEDGAAGLPLKKLVVNIEPAQSGSGDPSPENVRPISGWTECHIGVSGKNVYNADTYPIVEGKYINATNGYEVSRAASACSPSIPCSNLRGLTLTLNKNLGNVQNPGVAFYSRADGGYLSGVPKSSIPSGSPFTFTVPADAAYMRFSVNRNDTEIQLEPGTQITAYEPFTGLNASNITFPTPPGTVYSGTLTINDDGTGELKARPYYDTYNGETLIGPWLSSMDVYEDGTTPTIGAQVVDLSGAETVYQLTEQQAINTLLGSNSIWADCGQVSAEYPIETKFYIDAVSNEIVKRDDAIDDVERKLVEYAGKGYLYWVTGTMNAEGKCYFSASTKYPVSNFVRISKIIRAYFSGDTFVRLYAYDSGGGYLGRVLENASLSTSDSFAFSGELPIKEIKEKLPNVYYLRFACPSATRMDAHDNLHITIKTTEDERLLDNARWMGTSNQAAPMPLTLLHISDIHGNSSALHRINEKIDPYVNKINAKICTGDLVNNAAGQIDSWWDESIMTTIGNHDTRVGNSWTALSIADRIAYYISPFEENWGIVRGEGQSYYYKDFADAKVRLIVIDAMIYIPLPKLNPDEPDEPVDPDDPDYSDDSGEFDNTDGTDASNNLSPAAQAQNEWLSNTMDEAMNLGYHVLIAAHAPCRGATPFACSFTHAGRTEPYVGHRTTCVLSESVVELVKAKITAGCNFVGYLVGHTHKDDIWQAPDDPRQFFFTITCATWSQTAYQAREVDRSTVDYTGSRMSWDYASGANYDAANLVTIDTSRSLIKIIRVGGADIDMYMRRRKALCIRYSDGTLLGEI